MEPQAPSVGLVSRFTAFVALYAFLVKTMLALATPLATAGVLVGAGATAPPVWSVLCAPGAVEQAATGEGPSHTPALAHDAGCCLFHCQVQIAVLAPLVLATLVPELLAPARIWWPAPVPGDARKVAFLNFQARGPPRV